jgi:hypothetical protein
MAGASKIVDLATRTDMLLPAASVLSGSIKTSFEQANDLFAMDKAQMLAVDQLTAAELVAAAAERAAAPRPAVSGLGLTPAVLESELAAAVAAVTRADLSSAREAVATLDRRLADEQAAAALVAAVIGRIDAPRDPLVQVGLLGTDFGPTLTLARAAVGAIDLASTTTHVGAIDQALGEASLQGAIRLGLALALVLVAAVAVAWWRRRARASLATRAVDPPAKPG